MSNFNLQEKTKSVLDLIKAKLGGYKVKKLDKIKLGIFSEDFKQLDLEGPIFLNILEILENQGFITDLKITDPEGLTKTIDGFMPYSSLVDNKEYFPGYYVFKINKDFYKLYSNYSNQEIGSNPKNYLKNKKINFDDNKPQIIIDKAPIQIPPYKNEHYFCRAIFQHPINEFVDWSIIFENMDKILNSLDNKDSEKSKRMIQDTMYAVNNRIKDVFNTNDDLFTWQNKSIKRNY